MISIFFKTIALIAIIAVVVKAVVFPLVKEVMRLKKLQKKGKVTFGVVIGFNEKEDSDRYVQYGKIVKVNTESNEEIIFESQEYTFRKPLSGETIKVVYGIDNPKNAIEDFYKTLAFKLFLIILAFAAISFIVIASIKTFPTW